MLFILKILQFCELITTIHSHIHMHINLAQAVVAAALILHSSCISQSFQFMSPRLQWGEKLTVTVTACWWLFTHTALTAFHHLICKPCQRATATPQETWKHGLSYKGLFTWLHCHITVVPTGLNNVTYSCQTPPRHDLMLWTLVLWSTGKYTDLLFSFKPSVFNFLLSLCPRGLSLSLKEKSLGVDDILTFDQVLCLHWQRAEPLQSSCFLFYFIHSHTHTIKETTPHDQ